MFLHSRSALEHLSDPAKVTWPGHVRTGTQRQALGFRTHVSTEMGKLISANDVFGRKHKNLPGTGVPGEGPERATTREGEQFAFQCMPFNIC